MPIFLVLCDIIQSHANRICGKNSMQSRQKREDINLFKKGNLVSSSFPKTYLMIKYYGREDIESRKSATNCHSNWCTEKWDVIFFTMITSGSNVNNLSIDILNFEHKSWIIVMMWDQRASAPEFQNRMISHGKLAYSETMASVKRV